MRMTPYTKLLMENRANPGRRFEAVHAEGAADEVTLYLYDAIVNDALEAEYFGGVAPEPFAQQLRDITAGTIHLRINSPGGSVFAASAMAQAMSEHPARIVAHIDGVAASAATAVMMAADSIVMAPGAMAMIHNAWTIAMGNAEDLRHTAGLLDKTDGNLVQTYARRTGDKASAEQLATWMAAETWFTADEAVAAGLADSIAGHDDTPPQARWNLSAYARAPQLLQPPAAQPDPEPRRVDAAALLRRVNAAALTA